MSYSSPSISDVVFVAVDLGWDVRVRLPDQGDEVT
jgi:hypothetical protein